MAYFVEHTRPETGHDSTGRYKREVWACDSLKDAVKKADRLVDALIYEAQSEYESKELSKAVVIMRKEIESEEIAKEKKAIDDELEKLKARRKGL